MNKVARLGVVGCGKAGTNLALATLGCAGARIHGVASRTEASATKGSQAMRMLMAYHASHPESRLHGVSTAFSPSADHLGDSCYALFENAVACASWLREIWLQALATEAAKAR